MVVVAPLVRYKEKLKIQRDSMLFHYIKSSSQHFHFKGSSHLRWFSFQYAWSLELGESTKKLHDFYFINNFPPRIHSYSIELSCCNFCPFKLIILSDCVIITILFSIIICDSTNNFNGAPSHARPGASYSGLSIQYADRHLATFVMNIVRRSLVVLLN